ncbi:uncharacterized protein LOC126836913 [Adelges cooleyi]|uniref:uncharacterized protein LOC126836913 n=1 Tax=Adelges cooleyi TaxID=133065 RepID=UPI00217F9650|nr:uncharacterized protein LOC126836913 [Adelges cooleyi]
MDSFKKYKVTPPEVSGTQGAAGVSGNDGVKTGPNVAGSLRSSSSDRERREEEKDLRAAEEEEENIALARLQQLGPFSLCDEMDTRMMKICERLERHLTQGQSPNVTKELIEETINNIKVLDPILITLRDEIWKIDQELVDATNREKERVYYASKTIDVGVSTDLITEKDRTEVSVSSGGETLDEDEAFRMPNREDSPVVRQPRKRKKKDDEPISEPSFGSCNIQDLEDDDVAIETGLRLALVQATRLTLEVDGAQEVGEIADHIVETAHELDKTVTALNDLWATRSPNNYGEKLAHATLKTSDLRELGVQYSIMQECIEKQKGRGINRVIQDACSKTGVLLKRISERVETDTGPQVPLAVTSSPSVEKPLETVQVPVDGKDRDTKKVKKKRKKKKEKEPAKPGDKTTRRKLAPPRPQGIVISRADGGGSYADIARKLKDNIDLNALGVSIQAVRKTKEGHLAITVGKGADASQAALKLKAAAQDLLGSDIGIRASSNKQVVEIRDISAEDGAGDVYAGICQEGANMNEVSVQRITPSYGGTQKAIVTVTAEVANDICKKGKVRIGWVLCRVRPAERRLDRCFHCHGYGHRQAGCKGPDRRKLCMTCGGVEHRASDCQAPRHCVLCEEMQKKCDHYPGSSPCEAFRKAKAGR